MSDVGPYEILPYKEVSEMKREIAEIKRRVQDVSPSQIINSLDKINENVNHMLEIFKAASEEMGDGKQDGKIDELLKKVDQVEDHNRLIAEGIISISELIKEMRNETQAEEIPKRTQPLFKPFKPFEKPAPVQPPGDPEFPRPQFAGMMEPQNFDIPPAPKPLDDFPPPFESNSPPGPMSPDDMPFDIPAPPAPPPKKSLFRFK